MQNSSRKTITLSVLLETYLIMKRTNWSEANLESNGSE